MNSPTFAKVSADVQQVSRGIGLDKRIGPKFLNAGPGWRGRVPPGYAVALLKTAQDNRCPLRLVEATVAVNDQRKRAIAQKGSLRDGWQRARPHDRNTRPPFKPNTDDMRDAPSLALIQALRDAGARVGAYDPEGMDAARGLMPDIEYVGSGREAAQGAAALVIVTEWDAFRALELDRLGTFMESRGC